MKFKKFLSVLMCGAVICSLSACGSSASSDATEDVAETAETTESTIAEAAGENSIEFSDADYSETSFSGIVTAIDQSVITLSIMGGGGMPDGEAPDGQGGEMPNGQGGEAPEMPDDEAPDGQGGEAPEMPDGEAPDGQGGEMPDGEAPEMPDGEAPDGQGGEAPEMPDGEAPDGQGGEMPDGQGGEAPEDMEFDTTTATITIADESVLFNSDGSSATLSDITEGSFLSVKLDADGNISSVTISSMDSDMEVGFNGGAGGGASSAVESYDAVQEYTSDTDVTDESFTSTGKDENAIHIYDGASVTLNNIEVTRTSDGSTGGDNSSFYGVGAALLVSDDATAYINGGAISTDAAGGAGIFAYGTGTAYVNGTSITTKQDTSGGIHVAGGGTLYAWDLNITTNGESSAAIRSDRGSGTMVVDGGTYISNGTGSPAVYCTADITVNNATLTATNSEAVCIEGLNTLRLYDCDLTGAIQDNSQNECNWNIIVYQSMSGDSQVGNGTFSMIGGSLTANNGGMFYTTNTECTFYISDVDITYADENDFFLRCTGNVNQRGWGTSGNNGSQCVFTADSQAMEGDVIYDSISELDFYMMNGSTLAGAFIDDESCAGNGGSGFCNVYISSDSTWTVTGDSTITALYNEGTIVDEKGNAVSIIGTDGTVYLSGESSYTITVYSYSDSADFSGAATGDEFADYSVENPF